MIPNLNIAYWLPRDYPDLLKDAMKNRTPTLWGAPEEITFLNGVLDNTTIRVSVMQADNTLISVVNIPVAGTEHYAAGAQAIIRGQSLNATIAEVVHPHYLPMEAVMKELALQPLMDIAILSGKKFSTPNDMKRSGLSDFRQFNVEALYDERQKALEPHLDQYRLN